MTSLAIVSEEAAALEIVSEEPAEIFVVSETPFDRLVERTAEPQVEMPAARMTMGRRGTPVLGGMVPSEPALQKQPVSLAMERSVMRGVAPIEGPPLIEERGAPVDRIVFDAVQRGLESASAAERVKMGERTDWIGSVAKTVMRKWEAQDKAAKDIATLENLTGKVEDRTQQLIKQGLRGDIAKNEALRQIDFGDATSPLAQAEVSEFDFSGHKWWQEQNPFLRGGAKGAAALGSSVAGLAQFTYDVLGTQSITAAQRFHELMEEFSEQTVGTQKGPQRWVEGAMTSITAQAPAYAYGVATGAWVPGLLYLGVQQFGESYAEGKRGGNQPAENIARSSIFATSEVLGEVFALPFGIRGLRELMKGVPTEQLLGKVGQFMQGLAKREYPGELFTQAVESAADKLGPGGLQPGLTMEQYLAQNVDVVMQTTIQMALMGGAGTTLAAAAKVRDVAFPKQAFAQALAEEVKATYFVGAEEQARRALAGEGAATLVREGEAGAMPAPTIPRKPQPGERPPRWLEAGQVEPVQVRAEGTEALTYPYVTPEALYDWEAAPVRMLPEERLRPIPAGEAGAGEAIEAGPVAEIQPEGVAPLELPEVPEGQRWDGIVRRYGPAEPKIVPRPKAQSLLQRIIEMGGIDPGYAQDLTGESKMGAKGVPVKLFQRGTWRGGKGTGLDDVATRLAAEGWAIETDSTDGGVAQLSEMIRAELGGEKQYSMADTERMAAWEQDQLRLQAAVDEAEAGRAEPYLEREEMDGIADFVPPYESKLGPAKERLVELTARAADFDEAAVERLAMQELSDTEYETQLQEIIDGYKQGVAVGRAGVGEADQVFALEAQTEAQAERQGQAERERAERDREAERRGRADDLRADFTLTGSERAADEAVARGQQELDEGRYQVSQFTPAYIAKEKQIRERVTALARQLVPKAQVQFAKVLTVGKLVPAHQLPAGIKPGAHAAGMFDARTNIIHYALRHGGDTTLQHESIHWLRANGFFRPQEWRLLERQARKEWNAAYRVQDSEDGIAYAFGDWHIGQLQVGREISAIFGRLREFLERLGNAFRGLGFQTPADVFERVTSGEVGRRAEPSLEAVSELPTGQRFAIPRYRQRIRIPATKAQADVAIDELAADLRKSRQRGFVLDQTILSTFLSSPRNTAAWHETAAPVYDQTTRQWRERDRLVSVRTDEAQPYLDLSGRDADVVNKVLEHDRLTGKVSLTGKNMGVTFSHPDAVLSRPGETLRVTDKQKAGFWAARRMYSRFLDDLRDVTLEEHGLPPKLTPAQVLERIGAEPTVKGMDVAGLGIMTPESLRVVQAVRQQFPAMHAEWTREKSRLEFIADLVQQIEDARRSGYIPFMRFGDVGITVRDTADTSTDPRGRLVEFATAETGAVGTLAKHTYARHNVLLAPRVKTMVTEVKARHAGKGYRISEPFQIPHATMPAQVNLAEVGMLASMARIDQQTWAGVVDALDKAQAKLSFRRQFFEAKNIGGYSTDFQRATEQYIVNGASYIAQRRFRRPIREALEAINADGHHPKLYKTMKDYVEYVNTPGEMLQLVRNVNFIYYLSSIASWMVNATQTQVFTAPWAMQFASPAKVQAYWVRAEKDAVKMLSVSQGLRLFDPAKAPEDLREQMQRWSDDGELLPLTTLEAMGAARNRSRVVVGTRKAWETSVDLFGLGFTAAERKNRIAAMIMLYRLARDTPALRTEFEKYMSSNYLAKIQVIDLWDRNAEMAGGERAADNLDTWADAFARFGNADTNLVAGKINRPKVMRGPGTTVLQFFTFTWGVFELMARQAIKSGAPGVAAVGLWMLWISVLSGFPRGLPFADNLVKLYEFLYKLFTGVDRDVYFEAEEILADYFASRRAAESILYGATWGLPERHPLAVDLMRMGFGNLLPEQPLDFLGVTGSTLGRVGNVIEQSRWGNSELALAEAMPKLFGDPATARSWSMIGMRRQSSDEVVIPAENVTAVEIAQKAIGFTPVLKARADRYERERQRLIHRADIVVRAFATRQDKLNAEFERALIAEDKAAQTLADQKLIDLDAEIDRWNDAVPDNMQFQRKSRNIQDGLRAEFEGLQELRLRRVPRKAREAVEQLYEKQRTR